MIPLNGMRVVVSLPALALAQCIGLLEAGACSHSRVICAVCGGRFPLKRERLDELTAKGKTILCRTCLKTEPEGGPGVSTRPAKNTGSSTNPWHFIRRILYGHSI